MIKRFSEEFSRSITLVGLVLTADMLAADCADAVLPHAMTQQTDETIVLRKVSCEQ
jgi:hypothetical protein